MSSRLVTLLILWLSEQITLMTFLEELKLTRIFEVIDFVFEE